MDTRPYEHVYSLLSLGDDLPTEDLGVQDYPMKIGEEEQIAPLANSDTATLLEVLITAQEL